MEQNDMIALGANIRCRRMLNGVSRTGFAERLGLTIDEVATIERGDVPVTDALKAKIATALGCEPDDLTTASLSGASRRDDGPSKEEIDRLVEAFSRCRSPSWRGFVMGALFGANLRGEA